MPAAAGDLYACIDQLTAQGVLDVLAAGAPAVNTSQPVYTAHPPERAPVPGYSCPIHRTLHTLTQATASMELVRRLRELAAMHILEALWAAGYRPCTWRDVAMPAFLQPSSDPDRVLPLLDPFQMYCPLRSLALGLPTARCYTYWHWPEGLDDDRILELSERILFAARGGGWSPETHFHWPERFRATARAFLLTAHASSAAWPALEGPVTRARCRRQPHAAAAAASGGGPAGCGLGHLPPAVLLHILRLAATPLNNWLCALHSWE